MRQTHHAPRPLLERLIPGVTTLLLTIVMVVGLGFGSYASGQDTATRSLMAGVSGPTSSVGVHSIHAVLKRTEALSREDVAVHAIHAALQHAEARSRKSVAIHASRAALQHAMARSREGVAIRASHAALQHAMARSREGVAIRASRAALQRAMVRSGGGSGETQLLLIGRDEVEILWGRQWGREEIDPRLPEGYRLFKPRERRHPIGKIANIIAGRSKPIHTYTPFRVGDKHFIAFDEIHTATLKDGVRISGEFRGVSVFVKETSPPVQEVLAP